MYREKSQLTKTSKALLYILMMGSWVEKAEMFTNLRKGIYSEYTTYVANRRLESLIVRLCKQGLIKSEYKEARRVIKLTSKGELQALFDKARLPAAKQSWDGKWRLVIFDIPEHARKIRARLRLLLKDFGFRALQASVYVYPFALNGDAILFLRKSGLKRYIRILCADSFDDDSDLRKQFRTVIRKTDGRQKSGV